MPRRSERWYEIHNLNRQLEKVGRRICPTCERNCEFSARDFYLSSYGKPTGDCKLCARLKDLQRKRDKYKRDPAYRASIKERAKRKRRTPNRLLKQREYTRAYKQRKKLKRFTQVLGEIT